MKAKSIISLMVLVLSFASCRKPTTLIGAWEHKLIDEIEMYMCQSFSTDSHGNYYEEWFEARENGVAVKHWGMRAGKFHQYGNQIVIDFDNNDKDMKYNVDKLTSDELILSTKGGTLEYHRIK